VARRLAYQDDIWHAGRPRLRPHCVRWEPNSPQKGHSSQFSAHVYCGQTSGWIKMPLGTEVGLGPGDIVLDGEPAPPRRDTAPRPSKFRPMSIGQTAGCISIPLGAEDGLGPDDIVLEGGPARPPIFGPYLLWPNGCPSQLLLSSCHS